MKVDVLNINGESTGRSVELTEALFGQEPNEHAVYLTVKQYLANQRQGTHKAKERGEITGSTKKLHRQKGTGGSRKGDIKNPLFRGGGRIFGPRPRTYGIQVNKKVKQLAKASALSAKASAGSVIVVEDFSFDAPKTKEFVNILRALNVEDKKPLVVTADLERELLLSSRNIPKAGVMRVAELNVYQIVNAGTLVLAEGALKTLQGE